MFAIGLLFQCVFFYSIFDVYFRSPLVTGVEPLEPPFGAPASRVVLFVGRQCQPPGCARSLTHLFC